MSAANATGEPPSANDGPTSMPLRDTLAAGTAEERTAFVLRRIEDDPKHRFTLPAGSAPRFPLNDLDLGVVSVAARRALAGASPPWWEEADKAAALTAADFSEASLHRADFSGAVLRHANFGRSAMRAAVLTGACLEAAVFVDADLNGADLSRVRASEAVFRGALLEDANLSGAMLRFVDCGGALLDSANLEGADLWGARLVGAEIPYANLRGAKLQEAVLTDADLTGADLRGAVLKKADLTRARLRGANLEGADFAGADLTGADLTNASLPRVNLSSSTIRQVRLAGAWLESTRFSPGQLGGLLGEQAAGEYGPARAGYLNLEQNFRALGNAEAASWAYRRARRMGKLEQRQLTRLAVRERRGARAAVHLFYYLSDAFVEWLCDYGESLFRVLRAYAVAILAFAALYGLTGGLVASDDPRPARERTAIERPSMLLRFSFLTMTSGSSFDSDLRLRTGKMAFLASLQYTLGVVLTGLFGYVLGNRIRR